MVQKYASTLQAGAGARGTSDTDPASGGAPSSLESRTRYVQVGQNPVDSDGSVIPISTEPSDDGIQWGVSLYDFGQGEYEAIAYRVDEKPRKKKKKSDSDKKEKPKNRSDIDEMHRLRSAYRAKKEMRHKVMMMGADRMLTLTTRENISDRDKFLKCLDRFRRRCARQWPNFQTVIVLELQERGAYHAHLALNKFYNVNLLRYFWREAICGDGNASGNDSPGNIDMTSPVKGNYNRSKIARYLSKYMGKEELDLPAGSKRYMTWGKIPAPKKHVFYVSPTFDPFYQIKKLLESITQKRMRKFFELPPSVFSEIYWFSSVGN